MTKKVLTVKELLAQKKIIEKKQEKNYYSELLGGEIELGEKINKDDLLEYVADTSKGEYEKYKDVIYMCCPIFKSEELREAFKGELDIPTDIIDKVFNDNMQEVVNLGNFIFKKFGFLNDKVVENLKKQ